MKKFNNTSFQDTKRSDNGSSEDKIFEKPPMAHSYGGLRIETEGYSNGSTSLSLGDPIKLSPSPSIISPTRLNFDKITHLPTPIINNGSFGFNSPPRNPNNIEVLKRNNSPSIGVGANSNRTVSEYKPTTANNLTRKKSLLGEGTASKRISSNPITSSDTQIPSPPNDISIASKYVNSIFHSVHQNKYYKFSEEIGNGNFSTVICATNTVNEAEKIAIKIISIPTVNKIDIKNHKSFIKRELNILYKLNHPCLIHLIDYNINLSIKDDEIINSTFIPSDEDEINDLDYHNLKLNNDQLFFLNYCDGGNLFQFSFDYSKFNFNNLNYWLLLKRIICESIIGIAYLHDQNIIHRDIKLENILLNYSFDELMNISKDLNKFENPLICITDFGLLKKLHSSDELLSTRCGSQDYISPELLMGLKYNGKLTDSWSIGVLIYSLLEDRLPFDLPPLDLISNTGVSPSVIQRKRLKNNPAHRIAMIDWDWFKTNESNLSSSNINPEIRDILSDLKKIVNALLVRKDRRPELSHLLSLNEFSWIKHSLPTHFY